MLFSQLRRSAALVVDGLTPSDLENRTQRAPLDRYVGKSREATRGFGQAVPKQLMWSIQHILPNRSELGKHQAETDADLARWQALGQWPNLHGRIRGGCRWRS